MTSGNRSWRNFYDHVCLHGGHRFWHCPRWWPMVNVAHRCFSSLQQVSSLHQVSLEFWHFSEHLEHKAHVTSGYFNVINRKWITSSFRLIADLMRTLLYGKNWIGFSGDLSVSWCSELCQTTNWRKLFENGPLQINQFLKRSKTHWDHLLSNDALQMLLECFQRSGVTAGHPRRGRRRGKPPQSVQRRAIRLPDRQARLSAMSASLLLLLSLGSSSFLLLLLLLFAFLQKKKKRH